MLSSYCTIFVLGKYEIKCPKPIPTKEGCYCKIIRFESGDHIVRLLEYIEGIILVKVTCTPELIYQIGTIAAEIDVALQVNI